MFISRAIKHNRVLNTLFSKKDRKMNVKVGNRITTFIVIILSIVTLPLHTNGEDACRPHVSVGDNAAGVDAFEDPSCAATARADTLGCHSPQENMHCRHCKKFSTKASKHLKPCPQEDVGNIPDFEQEDVGNIPDFEQEGDYQDTQDGGIDNNRGIGQDIRDVVTSQGDPKNQGSDQDIQDIVASQGGGDEGPNQDSDKDSRLQTNSDQSMELHKYQAYDSEHAKWHKCKVKKRHIGHTGTGYLDFDGKGSWVEWDISVPSRDMYEISIRYSAKRDRPGELQVDGTPIQTLSFAGTSAWTLWASETVELMLPSGSHKIRVVASISMGPNIDYLSIQSKNANQQQDLPNDNNNDNDNENDNDEPLEDNNDSPLEDNDSNPQQQDKDNDLDKPKGDNDNEEPSPPDDKPSTGNNNSGGTFEETVVIEPGKKLKQGEFKSSPSGKYEVGLSDSGDLVLRDDNSDVIWRAGVSGGQKCFMQNDGNLIIRDQNNKAKWTTHTSKNHGSKLIVDDGGRIAVVHGTTPLWMDGIPRGQYTGPPSNNLEFPIRGAFYYPWYPETWTVNGKLAHFEPVLGHYSSGDAAVAEAHVDALEYGNIELSIASWWGPGARLDRARLTLLMEETIALQSELKWTIYHERERDEDASADELREDLDYLKKWFAWNEAWAHIDNRPVIFVYNEGNCNVAERWMEASNNEWYVVLKVFTGYRDCDVQPDSWHQYGIGNGAIDLKGVSYSVAPGFWRADRTTPKLDRLDKQTFRDNVQGMVDSRRPWQLVITFNEAGEGTMVEASPSWASNSGYGIYLDALHDIF